MRPLKEAVTSAVAPFVVVGDFNRRLTDTDYVWTRLTGRTKKRPDGNLSLQRVPDGKQQDCFGDRQLFGVDHFLLSSEVTATRFNIMRPTRIFGAAAEEIKQRFGDHCPLTVTVSY